MAKAKSTAQRLIEEAGLTKSYAYMIAGNGQTRRTPSLKLAVEIYQKTGLKFGPLERATQAEIKAIANLSERAA